MDDVSSFVLFFGDTPFIRIIDALLDNIGEDYSKKELQELAGVSKGAFFKHWPKIEELKIAGVTRSFGNTKLYTLNTKSPVVKGLLQLEMQLIEETSPKKAVAVAR